MSLKVIISFMFFLSSIVFAEVTPEANPEQAPAVKFRGYQNVTDELPFMGADWRVSFFQLASIEAGRLDDDGPASLFMYNFFSFNYKIDDDQRIAIRPVFTISSPGTDKYNENVTRWKRNSVTLTLATLDLIYQTSDPLVVV